MVDRIVDIPLPGQPLRCKSGPDRKRSFRPALQYFIAGPENRLVETAVRCVLEDRRGAYSPLVIAGLPGTGKSHLARGLVSRWQVKYPRQRVVCTTAVDFARELVDAIETHAVDELRARFRKPRLLVIEDIGRLGEKHAAQHELTHTLDALLAHNRWVVVTAPAAPSELPALIPRLRSRLTAGLTLSLCPPAPKTRLTILQRLAKLWEIDLPKPVAEILAQGLPVTVPRLYGVLLQLDLAVRVDGGTIDVEAARAYVAQQNGKSPPPLREIATAAARHFSLKLSELRSPSRRRTVVTARGVAMYLARYLGGKSLKQIGHYFGGRDHTTVIHGCRNTEDLLRSNLVIQQAVQQLQRKWQN